MFYFFNKSDVINLSFYNYRYSQVSSMSQLKKILIILTWKSLITYF